MNARASSDPAWLPDDADRAGAWRRAARRRGAAAWSCRCRCARAARPAGPRRCRGRSGRAPARRRTSSPARWRSATPALVMLRLAPGVGERLQLPAPLVALAHPRRRWRRSTRTSSTAMRTAVAGSGNSRIASAVSAGIVLIDDRHGDADERRGAGELRRDRGASDACSGSAASRTTLTTDPQAPATVTGNARASAAAACSTARRRRRSPRR